MFLFKRRFFKYIDYMASNGVIIKIDELEKMRKDTVLVSFKALS
jgi:hypothetical protein